MVTGPGLYVKRDFNKSQANQVNSLVYTMRDFADDILSSFGLPEEDKSKFNVVVEKFDAHFVKKRNVIFERAKFNQRRQEEGKPVDDFVTSLYCLLEHCRYGNLRDEMIRDRIFMGLRDSMLSEKLQLEPNLMLETAITFARQREQVKKQQQVIRADEMPSNIDAILAKKSQSTKAKQLASTSTKQPHKPDPVINPRIGGRCGKSGHVGKQQCSAREATCRKCHRRGHFQSVCRTRLVKL